MLRMDSFRNRLVILFAGLAFILGLCTTLYIGHMASAQMSNASGRAMYIAAKSISNTLANSLTEREHEMVLLSQSPFFAEADFHNPRIQQQLDQVKTSYKYYAWLGIANPDGKVEVSANQLLQGVDVSERPWFQGGLQQVYLGDVHKAVLLAKKLKAINPNEPMRFIDFATPIYDPKTKKVKGVLAAHADWSWASSVLNSAMSETAKKRGVEVFIVNPQGEILYPYQSIGLVKPPTYDAKRAAYFLHDWGEDRDYLTTDVPVVSNTQMSLGWHVIIRQPIDNALVDVRSLQHHILLIGFIISLLLLFITYRLANRLSQPIESLVQSAHAVETGQENVNFDTQSSIREIQGLSHSLKSMTETLLSQKQQLIDANATLEQKVQKRTNELELANAALEKLAKFDVLTGLHNRRAFNDYIDHQFDELQGKAQEYAVLLMDIDYFKKVNDQFGHEMGDHVLQRVARLISDNIRNTDFVARLGGEEFIAVLPTTTLQGATVLAEKIRDVIEKADIIENYTVTISIGISIATQQDTDSRLAMRRADQNLYLAKEQGRNRIIS